MTIATAPERSSAHASSVASLAPAAAKPTSPGATVTDRDIYFFDLRGYLLLKGAIAKEHVAELNGIINKMDGLQPPLKHGEWYGGVQAHTYGGADGLNLQQIYEAGEPFERLIDNPTWIEKVRHFIGGEGTYDYLHGPLFIDENFASIRGPGEAIGVHSGGHDCSKHTQFRYVDGRFMCGEINILMALTDIGPGDGATMVIPGSHKSHFRHPDMDAHRMKEGEASSLDGMEGAIEIHMEAGDAILFVDAIAHGSAKRVNPGQRRIAVYRYASTWSFFRHPYRPTEALLERLTPRRRKIVMPHEVIKREPNRIAGTPNPPETLGR